MAKLVFKNAGLLGVIAHIEASASFGLDLGTTARNYEKATGKKIETFEDYETIPKEYSKTTEPHMHFVKDSGIYVMSAGDKPLPEDKSHFTYAVGYNPDIDEDCWEKCREAVGGDDFGESFACTLMMKENIKNGADLWITVTDSHFQIETVLPKKRTGRIKSK